MKKSLKKSVSSFISLSLFASGMVAASAVMTTASAEVTFNAGVMSQYIFRGAVQRDSASLMGGADYAHGSGLYVGTWVAQVGKESGTMSTANGWEYDIYGGYKASMGDLGLGAGFTSYQYTNKINKAGKGFDTSYNELNFNLSYGPFTATINPGYREGNPGGGKDANYVFSSLKAEYVGFYGLLGHWEYDKNGADGDYQQVGYKTSLGGIDLDAALVHSSKNLNTVGKDAFTKDATTMMVSASKSF